MQLRVTDAAPLGASALKSPPIRILPSGCITMVRTRPFALGSKPSSAGLGLPTIVAAVATLESGIIRFRLSAETLIPHRAQPKAIASADINIKLCFAAFILISFHLRGLGRAVAPCGHTNHDAA